MMKSAEFWVIMDFSDAIKIYKENMRRKYTNKHPGKYSGDFRDRRDIPLMFIALHTPED